MLFRKQSLPVDKMIELEETLSSSILSSIGFAKTDEDLADQLGLEIRVVDNDDLPPNTEATLTKSKNRNFYGLIQVKKKYRVNMFACIHEIMHYVFDVKCNNYVEKTFERRIKGKTNSQHEQEINYLAAAYSMPYDQMLKAIKEFNESTPKADELLFVSDLCKKYGQSRVSVLRRVREVKRIARKKNAF